MSSKMLNKKLKVVWLCHFSNEEIQSKLNITKNIKEIAPWISLGIEEFKKRDDVELHVVSPHRWLTQTKHFSNMNIHYHFFNPGIPFYGRHWPSFFRLDHVTKYISNRLKIRWIIAKINPDIVNLHGIENGYYSRAVLDLHKYPHLITIQGLISLNPSSPDRKIVRRGAQLEQILIKKMQNFGIRVDYLKKYISERNTEAKFYWFKYPFKSNVVYDKTIKKNYDCVLFANIRKEKGAEDLIDAVKIVKRSIPNISIKIIGGCNEAYQRFLENKIKSLNLISNIKLLGHLPKQEDVHKIAIKAKLSILPTYNDILPGTIIESIKMGIPVIAYSANGVTDFNKSRETICLVDVGNVELLAKRIIELLNDESKRIKYTNNGLLTANEEFNNADQVSLMIDSYHSIIKEYSKS